MPRTRESHVLTKLTQLSAADIGLLAVAYPLTWGVRLALWTLRFPTTRRIAAKLAGGARGIFQADDERVRRVTAAVRRSARFVPSATCLTQALTTWILLGRSGYAADVRFGVARDDHGAIAAHAWVEVGGAVVIGGDTSPHRYATFPTFDIDPSPRRPSPRPAGGA